MGYCVAFAFIIGLCMYISSQMYAESKTIFHYFINANSIFCIQYLLASIPFLFFERFSVQKPLFCVIILDMFICIILLHKNKGIQLKKNKFDQKKRVNRFYSCADNSSIYCQNFRRYRRRVRSGGLFFSYNGFDGRKRSHDPYFGRDGRNIRGRR